MVVEHLEMWLVQLRKMGFKFNLICIYLNINNHMGLMASMEPDRSQGETDVAACKRE